MPANTSSPGWAILETDYMARNLVNFLPVLLPRSVAARALAAGLACLCLMQRSHAAETQTIHSFERTIGKSVGYKYLLSLPAGYDGQAEKRWPVLLFLHGSGERGDDVWQVAKH